MRRAAQCQPVPSRASFSGQAPEGARKHRLDAHSCRGERLEGKRGDWFALHTPEGAEASPVSTEVWEKWPLAFSPHGQNLFAFCSLCQELFSPFFRPFRRATSPWKSLQFRRIPYLDTADILAETPPETQPCPKSEF